MTRGSSAKQGLAGVIGIACAALLTGPMPARAGTQVTTGPFYSNYALAPEKGGGCISGTIGDVIPGNQRVTIYFLAEADVGKPRRSGSFAYADGVGEEDFLPGIGTFTLCLKPGDYRIYGIASDALYNRKLVNLPFRVVAGRNAYLGNFMFYGYAQNPDCPGSTATVFVGFRDEFERDQPHIRGGRVAGALPLEKHLIDPAAGAPYFLACKPM